MSIFSEHDFHDADIDLHDGFQSTDLDFVHDEFDDKSPLVCYDSIIEILRDTDYSVEAALSIMYTEEEMRQFSVEDFHEIEDELPEYGLVFDREEDVWVSTDEEEDEWL